jgi:CheY-like chemotaxis protein
MDGIEFIKYVRSKNKEIPIILASGSEVDMQNTEMRNLNVGWVIKKPYNFPEILSALQKFNL